MRIISGMSDSQVANLLGALSLALAEAQLAAAQRASGLNASACTVLVNLGPHPGLTIGELARIAGLTHSVMVRTVESLVEAKLVARHPGADRRQVALRLTPAGIERRYAILGARAAAIMAALAALGPEARVQLGELAATMLVGMADSRATCDHLCRLCDEAACGGNACPVERKAVRPEKERP